MNNLPRPSQHPVPAEITTYFTSPDGEADVTGREWHRLWGMLYDLTVAIANVPPVSGRERM